THGVLLNGFGVDGGWAALGGDERVDPLQVALGGGGLVFDEGTGVAVARRRLAAPGELVRQPVPPALEKFQPGRRLAMAAERELEGEGPDLVGAGGGLGPQQLREHLPAPGGDAVGLAGPARAPQGAPPPGGGRLAGGG